MRIDLKPDTIKTIQKAALTHDALQTALFILLNEAGYDPTQWDLIVDAAHLESVSPPNQLTIPANPKNGVNHTIQNRKTKKLSVVAPSEAS